MSNLLCAGEQSVRRAALIEQIEWSEMIREQLEAEGRTPKLLEAWNLRLINLRAELAKAEQNDEPERLRGRAQTHPDPLAVRAPHTPTDPA